MLEPDEKEEEKAQQNGEEQKEEEVDNVEQVERSREEEEKKKEDALWASFLSDVGQKPKAVAATQVTQIKKVTGAWACTLGVWEGPEGLEHTAGIRCWTELGRGWGCSLLCKTHIPCWARLQGFLPNVEVVLLLELFVSILECPTQLCLLPFLVLDSSFDTGMMNFGLSCACGHSSP